MKAAQIKEYGGPSAVQINEIEAPKAGPGQVLVEVYASSINPFDTTVRAGYMKEMIPLQLPVTLGGDIAGVVAEVGDGVTNFKTGDTVYGQANVVAGSSGAFAQLAATSSKQVAIMPVDINFNDAAALPLVGVSALQALTEHIKLQAGQKLFINGGAGGIGSAAIQIAKDIGAYVAVTATGDGIDYVKQLGADKVIDYKTEDFAAALSGYDAVFDTAAGDDFDKSLGILSKGGVAVSMIAQADEERARELGVMAITQSTRVSTESLESLSKLVESGAVVPQVDKVYPLEQIVQAFEARESGSVKGKVVVEIRAA